MTFLRGSQGRSQAFSPLVLQGQRSASLDECGAAPCFRHERSARRHAGPHALLMLHRPCGTVPDQWNITGGTTTSFTLSPIMSPFESLKQDMVVLDGINVTRETSPGNDHGITLVMILTGMQAIKDPNFTAFISPATSIDQVLATKSPLLQGTPIPSLQLGVDMRSDRNEVFTRTLSYSGPSSPLAPRTGPTSSTPGSSAA